MGWPTSSKRLFSARNVRRLATTAFYLAHHPLHHHQSSSRFFTRTSTAVMAYSSSSSSSMSDKNKRKLGPLTQALQGNFNNLNELQKEQLPTHPYMTIHHLTEPVASTQDEARRLLLERSSCSSNSSDKDDTTTPFFAVIADQQMSGRGTNGRTWESSQGNLYLTVALPMDQIPVMLTMLPLKIAVMVAERAELILQHCHSSSSASSSTQQVEIGAQELPSTPPFRVRVKWPNDVLLNDAKLSGTLIESATATSNKNHYESWFLIGIGVNVKHAPSLAHSPGKQIRPAVSLQDYCCGGGIDASSSPSQLPEKAALFLGMDLAYGMADWVMNNNSSTTLMSSPTASKDEANRAVLEAWKAWADFGKTYEIRSDDVAAETSSSNNGDDDGGYQGEKIVAVNIAPDGQLKIRGADGRERLLVSDYFF